MPKIDLDAIAPRAGSDYPPPYDLDVAGRQVRLLRGAADLSDFEANHVILPPGAWSSQRHWHEGEDELLVMIAGTAALIDGHGRTPLVAGDCVAFPKGDGNGHHLIGGEGGCTFVAISLPERSLCHYPDIDLLYDAATECNLHKDGRPY